MEKSGFKLEEIKTEHFMSLMDIYLTDRITRYQVLWDFVFRFFYATLIVLFVPNLSFLGIELPGFPKVIFPIIALIMSIAFGFICIGLAKKAEMSGKTFKRIMEFLPSELQRPHTNSAAVKSIKLLKWSFDVPANYSLFFSLSLPVTVLMFLALAILSIVMIIYDIRV